MGKKYKAVVKSITPIKEIVIGEWDKKPSEDDIGFELGLHWDRYIGPENVRIEWKLKDVI